VFGFRFVLGWFVWGAGSFFDFEVSSFVTSRWHRWIAQPPPKGQVGGSNPPWDANKNKGIYLKICDAFTL
jgi:hypothetical protein